MTIEKPYTTANAFREIIALAEEADIPAIALIASGGLRLAEHVPEPEDWADRPTPEDAAIKAAFPTRSGRHDLYAEAMRLVGARHSKGALVALVTWLLLRIETGGRDGG